MRWSACMRGMGGLLVAIVSLVLVGAACGDSDEGTLPDGNGGTAVNPAGGNGEDVPLTPVDASEGSPGTTPSGDEDADAPSPSGEVVDLAGGAIAGAVALTGREDGTIVHITLSGVPEGAYAAHIAEGSCPEPRNIAFALGGVTARDDGTVDEMILIEAPINGFAAGHSLTVQEDDERIIVCADIDADAG